MIIGDIETTEKVEYEDLLKNYYEKMEIIEEQDKEIQRLNNIVNELESHLYKEWLEWKDSDCESIYVRAFEDKAIYDYIQEIKGDKSNDN